MPTIIPVVEGPGDVAAAPILLNRILQERFGRADVAVSYGKQGVVNSHGRQKLEAKLESFLMYARIKPGCDAILVLLDADDDCPVLLASQLLQRCEGIGLDCPVQFVCACRSFESWFLASLDTIRGHGGIQEMAALSQVAENISNPKDWLSAQMPQGRAYKETAHQAALSGLIDINQAVSNSRSFRRLCHAIEQLLVGLDASAA